MHWALAPAHREFDKLVMASISPLPSWKLINLLMQFGGLMAWPTKNTTVTDLSKLLGIYGLIITQREKKGACGGDSRVQGGFKKQALLF